ncbi:MAG: RNA methyltransferase [Muribaculaceae bacterium]|jgi:tRNA G18 (ribose-2'-O)-methylase SpoU|nr:RNA methyltransferase [Muribaculaceae bacterium]
MDKRKKNIIELTRITIDDYRRSDKLPVKVVVDSVRSMNNIGSIFRTSDAFMVDEIILCGITATPPHPEIHKTALGAEESVAWRYEKSAEEAVRKLQEAGVKVCCLEQTHNSVPLHEFIPSKDEVYAIVVGNEVEGVNQSVVDAADTVIEIPQFGTKHSLNVAVSAGLAIWHFIESLKLMR